jgi:membrane protein
MSIGGRERRWGAYDQRLWREERRAHDEAPVEAPPRSWREIARTVVREMGEHQIPIVAAAVAFYGLLAIFPALTALVAIYGLVADPQQVESQVSALSAMLPTQAASILTGQLHDLVQTNQGALRAGAIAGVLLALWSTAGGVRTVMKALNVAYGKEETRGTIKLYGTSLLLTMAAIVGMVLMIGIIVALPVAASALGLGSGVSSAIAYVRWPIAAVAAMVFLALMYRHAPNRHGARWRWLTWGAAIAIVMWIAGSALFSLYVTRFGNYNETYGAMGAVVILLTWFLLSAYALLIGAEIDAVMERRATSPEFPRAPS